MPHTDTHHTSTAGLHPIPQEVLEFMDSDRGRTLLVLGAPGTGKTLFTIRLLNILAKRHGEPLYVTSRIDEQMIVDTHLQGLVGLNRGNVLDISTGPGALPWDVDEAFDIQTIDSLFSWIRSIEAVSSRPVIAFDSWEIICQHLSNRQSAPLNKDALNDKIGNIARSGNIDLVLVTESETVPQLEYAVDGVVSLNATSDERGRTHREILLEKLRGVRIENRRRPITLADGKFNTFSPVSSYPVKTSSEDALWPSADNSKAKFATGIPDLNETLEGGYNRGGTVHIEIGRDLSRDTWSLAVLPTVMNFLSESMGAVVLPPSESSPGLLHQHANRVLPEGRFDSLCEVFSMHSNSIYSPTNSSESSEETGSADEPSQEDGMTVLQPDGIEYSKYVSTVGRVRERSCGPIIQVLGLDAVYEGIPEFGERLGKCANEIALHNDLGILISKSSSNLRDHANRIADMHFYIEKRGKTLVMYGENPLTPILGVGMDTDDSIPEVTLTEMV